MNLKNQVINLDDGNDYFVYDVLEIDNRNYYLLFRMIDNNMTDEVTFLKKNGNTLIHTLLERNGYSTIRC